MINIFNKLLDPTFHSNKGFMQLMISVIQVNFLIICSKQQMSLTEGRWENCPLTFLLSSLAFLLKKRAKMNNLTFK